MANILSGLIVKEKIKEELREKVKHLCFVPKLYIIQVGDREDSNIYIKHKQKFGEAIGVDVEVLKFEESISEVDLQNKIIELNSNSDVNGIIIQLPLPLNISPQIINEIDPKKDVDGLTEFHKNELFTNGRSKIVPATARAIVNLLNFYKIPIKSKNIAVLGRSELVGKPIALILRSMGAIVNVIHSQTENPQEICYKSDILVVAIGKPKLIDSKYINQSKSQVVIDVGIHKINGKIVGDVDFESVSPLISAITPVPGGVGPLTVTSLFQNLLDLISL